MTALDRAFQRMIRNLHSVAEVTKAMQSGMTVEQFVAESVARAEAEAGRSLKVRERGDVEVMARQRWYALQAQWPDKPARREPEVCLLCGGAGRVRRDDYQPAAGNVVRYASEPCPLCYAAQEGKRLRAAWPLPPALREMAARPVGERSDAPQLRQAIARTQQFARLWPAGVVMALTGGYGSGKTHLLAKVYDRAWRAGLSAIYTTGPELEKLYTNFDNTQVDSLPEEQLWPLEGRRVDLVKVDVLLVDEADRYSKGKGAERHLRDGWVERQIFELVSQRQLAGQSTVLAGNKLGDPLGGVHPGIIDRAQEDGSAWWIDLADTTSARPLSRNERPSLLDG